MPAKTTSRKSSKRARTNGGNGRYMRRSSYSSPYSLLRSLPVGGVAKTKLTKLVFAQGLSLDPSANSYQIQNINLNNPANVLNTAQAPMSAGNMSTWNAIYGKWTVLGARVTFTITPDRATYPTAMTPGYVGIYVSFDDGTTINNILSNGIPQIMEQPRNMTMKSIPYAYGNQQKDMTISKFVDCASAFSVPQSALWSVEDDYSGTGISVAATAPVRRLLAQLWVGNIDGNNVSELKGIIKVEYIIRWSEPKDTRLL